MSEYRNALKSVRRFVTCKSKECHHSAINNLEELLNTNLKQSSLSDFYTAKIELELLIFINNYNIRTLCSFHYEIGGNI